MILHPPTDTTVLPVLIRAEEVRTGDHVVVKGLIRRCDWRELDRAGDSIRLVFEDHRKLPGRAVPRPLGGVRLEVLGNLEFHLDDRLLLIHRETP